MFKKNHQGFSVIEVLVVIAVIAIIAGITLPVSYSFLNKNDLSLTAQKITQTARRAQLLSQANDSDSVWGIHVQVGRVAIFKGSVYESRDTTRDEVYVFPDNETLGGITDFTFAKLTGYPTTPGTLTITSLDTSTKSITINSRGMIEY